MITGLNYVTLTNGKRRRTGRDPAGRTAAAARDHRVPHAHVTNWFLLALILVAASTLTASLGLLGTLMGPRKMQMLFAVAQLSAARARRSAQKYRGRRNCCYP